VVPSYFRIPDDGRSPQTQQFSECCTPSSEPFIFDLIWVIQQQMFLKFLLRPRKREHNSRSVTTCINILANKDLILLPIKSLLLQYVICDFCVLHWSFHNHSSMLLTVASNSTGIALNTHTLYLILPVALGLGVYSASNRNEYQKH
jgi:hypothetical protein